jgi:hypothetical protein
MLINGRFGSTMTNECSRRFYTRQARLGYRVKKAQSAAFVLRPTFAIGSFMGSTVAACLDQSLGVLPPTGLRGIPIGLW